MADVTTTVRLPDSVHKSVKASANKNARSFNGEIIVRLRGDAAALIFTPKQAKALERAWAVLHYGYVDDESNGYDAMKRSLKKDRAAALVLHEMLGVEDDG